MSNKVAEVLRQRMQNDPELQRAATKLQALGEFVRLVTESPEWQAEIDRARQEWQTEYGQPFPRSLDDIARLLSRAGFTPEYILQGGWTPTEVMPIVEGYLQRLSDGQQSSDQKPAALQLKDRAVLVKGKPIPLNMTPEKTEDALAFLEVLCAEPGNWFSSQDIGKAKRREGVRFDLVYKILPKCIKDLIEPNRRKGYRLLRK